MQLYINIVDSMINKNIFLGEVPKQKNLDNKKLKDYKVRSFRITE
jgi:hypothetical protein